MSMYVKELAELKSHGVSDARLNELAIIPGAGTTPDKLDDDGNVFKRGTIPADLDTPFIRECVAELRRVTGDPNAVFECHQKA